MVFSILLKRNTKHALGISFFRLSFYLLILSVSALYFFDKASNEYFPLILVAFSLVAFEILNLFYNLSLHNVAEKKKRGLISNLGWATGYFGGLLSLIAVLTLLNLTQLNDYKLFGQSIFLLIGPFVGLWTLIFGFKHIDNYKNKIFKIDNLFLFLKNIKEKKISGFLISYFFLIIQSFVFSLLQV